MTEYVEDAGLSDALKAILSDVTKAEFAAIRDTKLKIIPLLKVKTNKEGEHTPCVGIPAQVRKVSDLHRAAGIDAHYIMVVDYYAWNHPKGINPQITLDAMLHHALKTIKVEVKEGKPKFGHNDPDVEVFIDTVNRYGAFEESLQTVSDLVLAAPHAAAQLASGDLGTASEGVTSGTGQEAAEAEAPKVPRRKR
jgi:hypothetical protein